MAMAAGEGITLIELQEHVTCPVCFKIFRDPKELQCSHTVCTQCIPKLQDNSQKRKTIVCPTCNDSTKLKSIRPDHVTSAFSQWYQHSLNGHFITNTDVPKSSVKGTTSASCTPHQLNTCALIQPSTNEDLKQMAYKERVAARFNQLCNEVRSLTSQQLQSVLGDIYEPVMDQNLTREQYAELVVAKLNIWSQKAGNFVIQSIGVNLNEGLANIRDTESREAIVSMLNSWYQQTLNFVILQRFGLDIRTGDEDEQSTELDSNEEKVELVVSKLGPWSQTVLRFLMRGLGLNLVDLTPHDKSQDKSFHEYRQMATSSAETYSKEALHYTLRSLGVDLNEVVSEFSNNTDEEGITLRKFLVSKLKSKKWTENGLSLALQSVGLGLGLRLAWKGLPWACACFAFFAPSLGVDEKKLHSVLLAYCIWKYCKQD